MKRGYKKETNKKGRLFIILIKDERLRGTHPVTVRLTSTSVF